MEKFVENINNTIVDLTFNENFEVESADMTSPETIAIDFIKENDLNEIYTNFNGVEFQWTHLKHQLFGSLKIQSATNFFEDSWEFMVDEVEECSGCDLETFRVFDFYANQNYVGCFLNNYKKEGLFYIRENTAYPLHISATTYLKLAEKSLGIMNWAALLVKYNLNIEFSEAKDLERNLLTVFPAFDLDSFREEYLSLRIKK